MDFRKGLEKFTDLSMKVLVILAEEDLRVQIQSTLGTNYRDRLPPPCKLSNSN